VAFANDCRTFTQGNGNGPDGPAVGSRMNQPHDRTRLYDSKDHSPAEIPDEQLPDEPAHKRQLQRIVANHPIEPYIRKANAEERADE